MFGNHETIYKLYNMYEVNAKKIHFKEKKITKVIANTSGLKTERSLGQTKF